MNSYNPKQPNNGSDIIEVPMDEIKHGNYNATGATQTETDSASDNSCQKANAEEIQQSSEVPSNTRKLDKTTEFLKRYGVYFAAPIFIILMFCVLLSIYNIYPFGGYSMSSYDMLAQISPFYEHFFDVIDGHSSLFYSFSVAGGADLFGTLAYFAVSPFSFIFLLGGKCFTSYMVPFALAAKLCCVSVSAIFCIRKLFPNVKSLSVFTLALLYTFSGYMYVANTYINWVDFLIYLPLLGVGFSVMAKGGKIRYFVISLALMLYTCFSIACFSLLLMYLIFIVYGLIVKRGDERKKYTLRLVIALVLAVAAALPLLFPAFMSYVNSGRKTAIFDNLYKAISYDHLYDKLTYIFCDAVILALALLYFVRCDKKDRINLFLIAAAVIIFAPIFIDECCNLLNAGSYMSYALRFGFLNSFLGLYLAGKCLNELDMGDDRVKYYKTLISSVVMVVLLAIVGVVMATINNVIQKGEDSFLFSIPMFAKGTKLYELFEKEDFCKYFSSSFAHSTGGLEAVAIVFFIIAAVMIALVLFTNYNMFPKRLFSVALCVISLFQVVFYCSHMIYGDRNTLVTYDQYYEYADIITEGGEKYYTRVKDYNNRLSNNLPLFSSTRSISVFSSVIDSKNFDVTSFFEYNGNGRNSQKSGGGTVFSDCLFGYEYAYATTSSINRSYWIKQEQLEGNPLYLYKNPYAFPQAFLIKKGETEFVSDCYFEKINEYSRMLGSDTGVVIEKKVNVVEKNGYFTLSFTASDEGNYYFDFHAPDGTAFLYNQASTYSESSAKTLGERLSLGYYKTSKTSYLSIKQTEGVDLTADEIADCCFGAIISVKKTAELCAIARENAVDITFGSNTFNVNVDADEDCYLFISYIDIDGMKVTDNGKSGVLYSNGFNFMITDVYSGSNAITIKYTSPYIGYSAIALLIAAALFAFVGWVYKKHFGALIHLSGVATLAAFALAFAVFAFFIAFPFGVFVFKLVGVVF